MRRYEREQVESIRSGKERHKRRITMELRIYSSQDGAQMNAAEEQLSAWLANQKTLVNTGDSGFQNSTELLLELRGYEISSVNINAAIDRIQAPGGKFVSREGRLPLHFVQTPRRTSPISPAAKADDGSPFLGGDMIRNLDGSYRNKNYAEQKSEREAAEAASQRTGVSAQSRAAAEAKS